LINFSLNF